MKPYHEHNGITIYHGDCRPILAAIDTRGFDFLCGDPPYGINYRSNHNTRADKSGWAQWARDENFAPITGDDKPFDPAHLLHFPKVALFGANYYASRLPDSKCWIVWDKREDVTPDQGADCELIWTNLQKQTRMYKHLWRGLARRGEENVSRQPKYHPHQKPVALLMWLMRYADARGVIDPYMGSGSGLVAAKKLGLPAIGIDVEQWCCDVAIDRLERTSEMVQEIFV
jgi:site-specific DNA-methyltransferase (adenine-specific)